MTTLLVLYAKLVGWAVAGWAIGKYFPSQAPERLGQFLFWVGVPISIFTFLRQADLSGSVWWAAIAAWGAMLLGLGLAQLWLRRSPLPRPSQGSVLLASMVGNTGYLGYPIILALVGAQNFAWALFYDLLGTTLGAYGLGVLIASRYGLATHKPWELLQTLLKNPALWSFAAGLVAHDWVFWPPVNQALSVFSWGSIALALLLIGMRLRSLSLATDRSLMTVPLLIKMLVTPLVIAGITLFWPIDHAPRVVLILQSAMPPAFATLVLAESFQLDRSLSVGLLALGSIGLLLTLPLWLWSF